MASIIRAYVMCKWALTANRRTMVILDAFPSGAMDRYGGGTDQTGQPDGDLSVLPVCIVQVEVTSAQLTAIQADNRFIVVAQQTLDSVTGDTSGGNWNSTLTQTQVNGFKSWLSTNWSGIPQTLLNRCDNLVGMTRKDAALAVIGFIKTRQDAGV